MQPLREPVLEALSRLGISYEMVEHPPMFTTDDMQAFGMGEHGKVLKNLFLRDAKGKRHFLVVTSSEKKADLEALRTALGSTRLSFGSSERLQRFLNTTQGSVCPFAVLHDKDNAVEVVFDKSLCGLARVGVHPCDNTATLWLAFSDIERLVRDTGHDITYVEL
jgi:prolyl-tRNA editing protein proX